LVTLPDAQKVDEMEPRLQLLGKIKIEYAKINIIGGQREKV